MSEVVQPVKLSGLPGLQLNDAEGVLDRTAKKMLNVPPQDVDVRYMDDNHHEDLEEQQGIQQKLFLQDQPSRFEISVSCAQGASHCNLIQMELLSSGRDTAYVAANGIPAVISEAAGGNLGALDGSSD